jgi:hypothetical protein
MWKVKVEVGSGKLHDMEVGNGKCGGARIGSGSGIELKMEFVSGNMA